MTREDMGGHGGQWRTWMTRKDMGGHGEDMEGSGGHG